MRRGTVSLACVILLAALLAASLIPGPARSQTPVSLRFMTGPQGGSWFPLGGAIAEIIQKELPHVNVTVMPGAGIANVKAIEAGKADLGFGNANSTADAIAGRLGDRSSVCQSLCQSRAGS